MFGICERAIRPALHRSRRLTILAHLFSPGRTISSECRPQEETSAAKQSINNRLPSLAESLRHVGLNEQVIQRLVEAQAALETTPVNATDKAVLEKITSGQDVFVDGPYSPKLRLILAASIAQRLDVPSVSSATSITLFHSSRTARTRVLVLIANANQMQTEQIALRKYLKNTDTKRGYSVNRLESYTPDSRLGRRPWVAPAVLMAAPETILHVMDRAAAKRQVKIGQHTIFQRLRDVELVIVQADSTRGTELAEVLRRLPPTTRGEQQRILCTSARDEESFLHMDELSRQYLAADAARFVSHIKRGD